MKAVTLLPADVYQVVNKSFLNEEDKLILSMLYMPVIGATAVMLYNTLYNELKAGNFISNEITHHHLMTNLCDSLDNIKNARIKLEGIGLMKTYYMEGGINSYVYELYSPLSVSEFFGHPVFNMVFYNNVGKEEYERIKNYFKVPSVNLSGYSDITSPFDMTFKSVSYSNFELENSNDVIKKVKLPFSYDMVFDFEAFISSIPSALFNQKALTKSVKELISHLAFLYDIDPFTMADMAKISLNEKGIIDKEALKNNVRKYYQFNNSGRLPSLMFKSQPEYLRSPNGDNSKKGRLIKMFETTKPYDFLKSKYNGAKPPLRDLRILEMLVVDLRLNPAVCNVLIDYVLKTQNNRLVKGFVETLAGEWKRANIETAKEAMEYALRKTKKNSFRKEEVIPEWFNESQVKENMSSNEREELEGFFKEFV